MTATTPIRYRELWDVPRIFFTTFNEQLYLFDCQFDESVEDYPESYQVFLMPTLTDMDYSGSWVDLWRKAVRKIGDVPVSAVRFDPTRRASIGAEVFDTLAPAVPVNGHVSHAQSTPVS
jgi:hypothetical protein